MGQLQLLQIVVASPSDVQAERDALDVVVANLNRLIAEDRGLHLNVVRWERDAYAGFHANGPQGLIDAILRIPECDIFVGIFWKRFGTPTNDGMTGTEHEFRVAYEAWKQKGAPHIALYFSQKKYMPQTEAEVRQQAEVLRFKQNIPPEGLWWNYQNAKHFQELVSDHLANYLRHRFPVPRLFPPESERQPQLTLETKEINVGYQGGPGEAGTHPTLYTRILAINTGQRDRSILRFQISEEGGTDWQLTEGPFSPEGEKLKLPMKISRDDPFFFCFRAKSPVTFEERKSSTVGGLKLKGWDHLGEQYELWLTEGLTDVEPVRLRRERVEAPEQKPPNPDYS